MLSGSRRVRFCRKVRRAVSVGDLCRTVQNIRALCRRAIEVGVKELIIFRTKPVRDPRPESEGHR